MWFKKDRYISLASPLLPLNAKSLQAHKTKASLLGLHTLGQQGNIREQQGFLIISLGIGGGDGKWIGGGSIVI